MPPTHEQQRRLIKFFDRSIRRHPDRAVLVSEGDSWFSYPLHPNVISVLDTRARRRVSLLRLERTGEELLTILSGKQKAKLRRQLARFPVQALLVSGGGNDIVGENLLPLLRDKTPGRGWEQCIHKQRFARRLQQLELAYREILEMRDDVNPGCTIYTHGYDRAIPTGRGVRIGPLRSGPWLRPFLEQRGITDPADQRALIGWMIDRFNDMLISLAATQTGVVHVDCRGTLGDGDWHNELHPSRAGFRAVAGRFAASLGARFPGVFG